MKEQARLGSSNASALMAQTQGVTLLEKVLTRHRASNSVMWETYSVVCLAYEVEPLEIIGEHMRQSPFYAMVQQRLGDKADNLQIVFVSIDPERDTPQALKDYLSSDGFPKETIGLTGTPEQVATAAKAYRAFYQKVGEGEGYTMNHSLTVYLMGPDGKFRTAVAYGMGPDKTTRIIEQAMARG